jgi:Ca2+-transporting ATPase
MIVGLTELEAKKRLSQYGLNQILAEEGRSPLRLLLLQFRSPLVLILLFACFLSLMLGEWLEAVSIAVILGFNALIGFYQEFRAETAVKALSQMTAPRARVLREGMQKDILAAEVVPGDWLLLEAGDIVAADGQILEAARLQTNEAILTGESLPIPKKARGDTEAKAIADRNGSVFMGTAVSAGTGRILVHQTGMKTELGQIAHLINQVGETATPLQIQLAQVGKTLLWLCLGVVALVFVMGLLQGQPWLELVIFALSLAVAAVPEGLPAIVTVALAFGVQRMAARKALIRRLSSVETLGSVSVICTDKTGTLTTGQMRVRELWGPNHRQILEVASACCDSELSRDGNLNLGDPTELAILLEARERGIEKETIEKQNPRIKTEPFDSERMRMAVVREDGRIYIKGALERILPLCAPGETVKGAELSLQDMSSRGLRVLAVALGNGAEEKELCLVGLIGLADPPRTEVAQAIEEAKEAGILPIMITGDHLNTAIAIAQELGLLIEGEPSQGKVHARATPEDKLKLVREWKEKGAIVAMTGDGVNDAPALREAHVGIAMGKTGTQVTRQSADLVLADDNFATIVAAVREGRGVYQNIRKAIVYLLTGNFAELLVVFGASVVGAPLPFLAPHLLWINLVTDALPALALIADPTPEDIMKRKPRPSTESILGPREWRRILIVGMLEAASVGTLFWLQLQRSSLENTRGLAFTTLVFSQLLRSLSARSKTKTYWQLGMLSNLWVVGIVIGTFALQMTLHFIPLGQSLFGLKPISLEDLMWILPFSLFTMGILEISKLVVATRSMVHKRRPQKNKSQDR